MSHVILTKTNLVVTTNIGRVHPYRWEESSEAHGGYEIFSSVCHLLDNHTMTRGKKAVLLRLRVKCFEMPKASPPSETGTILWRKAVVQAAQSPPAVVQSFWHQCVKVRIVAVGQGCPGRVESIMLLSFALSVCRRRVLKTYQADTRSWQTAQ